MTHLLFALVLHAPDVYKCKALLDSLILIYQPVLWQMFILSGTHAHILVSTDLGQNECLYQIESSFNMEAG